MADGLSPKAAMPDSIRIRTRPVLMTAFAVAAGMLPVAIGGLIVGTFLTLLFIPLIFVLWVK